MLCKPEINDKIKNNNTRINRAYLSRYIISKINICFTFFIFFRAI